MHIAVTVAYSTKRQWMFVQVIEEMSQNKKK